MSELKATSSGEIRARDALLGYWWYEKSEADKVIADLEESHKMEVEQLLIEIAELKAKNAQAEDDCAYWKMKTAEVDKAIRHANYKRCLAMASLSLEKRETYRAEYEEWCLKWYKRWLELAEKFKEAK